MHLSTSAFSHSRARSSQVAVLARAFIFAVPSFTSTSGLARRLRYQPGCCGAPPFEATTRGAGARRALASVQMAAERRQAGGDGFIRRPPLPSHKPGGGREEEGNLAQGFRDHGAVGRRGRRVVVLE